MATAYDGTRTGPAFNLTAGDNNKILRISDVSPNHNETGGIALHFVADGSWSGTIQFKCRNAATDAETLDLPFLGPWPYRKYYLNGSAADGSLVTTTITTTSSVVVPTSGQMLALAVTCSAGSCAVYYQPAAGATAP